jgi:hypothetical protein
MYTINTNHGTVGGVKTDFRANGMLVVRDGIYVFIWSSVKDAVWNFILIASNNWMAMNCKVCGR